MGWRWNGEKDWRERMKKGNGDEMKMGWRWNGGRDWRERTEKENGGRVRKNETKADRRMRRDG